MKEKKIVLLGFVAAGLLNVTQVNAAVPPPPPSGQMVTLSWAPDLIVNVRQSANLSVPTSTWSTLATLGDTNTMSIPATSSVSFFVVSAVGQFMKLAWDFPAELITPEVSFNLYWRPDAGSNWTLSTNIPSDTLEARVYMATASGQFALTALNADTMEESPFSNIAPFTNSVGRNLPVKITKP